MHTQRETKSKRQRLIRIHELIAREPNSWTCGKLGVYFNISKQQAHRDVQALLNAGYPIQSSSKGYFIELGKKPSPPVG